MRVISLEAPHTESMSFSAQASYFFSHTTYQRLQTVLDLNGLRCSPPFVGLTSWKSKRINTTKVLSITLIKKHKSCFIPTCSNLIFFMRVLLSFRLNTVVSLRVLLLVNVFLYA